MSIVQGLVVVLHLLGMAAILGGWFATRTSPRVHPAMLWGARSQIVTGLILVGLAEAGIGTDGEPVNHPKIGVKLVVALAVAALVEIANARQKRFNLPVAIGPGAPTPIMVAAPLVQAAAGLALLNVLVAVLWT
ncbi:hypothetical protein [Lapillicoccus jejuensis]|uniref:Uncharacterized protein n=1 Tax=Lapillicoccus jejuensis TaxID=402171 RepID=A0A542E1Y8_9MICO|nr:hypothetical protein [Lapillicoccus jejuensis]TQJ09363.1 hypothetical protein FB458_2474 [Lapillicoccus jejuensis]